MPRTKITLPVGIRLFMRRRSAVASSKPEEIQVRDTGGQGSNTPKDLLQFATRQVCKSEASAGNNGPPFTLCLLAQHLLRQQKPCGETLDTIKRPHATNPLPHSPQGRRKDTVETPKTGHARATRPRLHVHPQNLPRMYSQHGD